MVSGRSSVIEKLCYFCIKNDEMTYTRDKSENKSLEVHIISSLFYTGFTVYFWMCQIKSFQFKTPIKNVNKYRQ